ncbi:aromatic aminotransferase [Fusarium longipes]|uniref:Aromatic aminotransferase n=1 Tax=Fusarium longipes TaxID=694270 RepID=A0A395SX41_9HYPO|nr:aromatic aminotransferase [Fusarium longipes]
MQVRSWVFSLRTSLRELTILQGYVRKPPDGSAIRGLLEAAPALERVEFNEVYHEVHESTTPYLSHTNVKGLIFSASTIPRNHLKSVMNGSRKLRTFRFGWVFMMMWPGIIGKRSMRNAMSEIVMKRKDTVKRQSLDLSNINSRGLEDLTGMSVLETLHIHRSMLSKRGNDSARTILTVFEILPSSIRDLGVIGATDMHLWEEVIDLVTTSSLQHPHLRRVIIASEDLEKQDCCDWIDALTSVRNDFDIEVSVQEPQYWKDLTSPSSHWTEKGTFKQSRSED